MPGDSETRRKEIAFINAAIRDVRQEIGFLENQIACKKEDLSALERTARILARQNSTQKLWSRPPSEIEVKVLATVPVDTVVKERDVRKMLEAKYPGEKFARSSLYKVLHRTRCFERSGKGYILKSQKGTDATSVPNGAGQTAVEENSPTPQEIPGAR